MTRIRRRRPGSPWLFMQAFLLFGLEASSHASSLVLYDTNIYTADPARPRAEAVVAVNGRITYVGTTADALKRAPRGSRRMDLKGRTVLPGLTDSHVHLSAVGFRELDFDLTGTASLEELKARVRQRAQRVPVGSWLTGRGWIESRWPRPVFPTRGDLDESVSDRAVVLVRADGHALVANSLALKRAGIDRSTADPPGGRIERDAAGEPTGMLIDDAMDLLQRQIPPRTDAEISKALELGATRSVRLGLTQVQIAGNPWKEVDLLCRLYSQHRIQLRIYDAIGGPGADADRLLKEGASIHRCGDRLTVRTIKLYMDGALGSRGAALLQPYSDLPSSTGLFVTDPTVMVPILTEALRRGIQIETHAIGDRANRTVLDLYERAFKAVPVGERLVAEPRWRVEHAQILSRIDIPRFAQLGVIASMQPSHAISDLFFAPARLGKERLSGAYAWRALLDTGALITAGSDAPVEKGDPRIEFYAAVARRSLEGFADESWHLEQRVSREEALRMLTSAPAFAAFQEKERGSIEVGKLADFSVFSADLMTIPEADILKAKVAMTIIAGQVVYSSQ